MKKIKVTREWSCMMARIRFDQLLDLAIREGPQLVQDDYGRDIVVMDALEFERRAAEVDGRRLKREATSSKRATSMKKVRQPQRKFR